MDLRFLGIYINKNKKEKEKAPKLGFFGKRKEDKEKKKDKK